MGSTVHTGKNLVAEVKIGGFIFRLYKFFPYFHKLVFPLLETYNTGSEI